VRLLLLLFEFMVLAGSMLVINFSVVQLGVFCVAMPVPRRFILKKGIVILDRVGRGKVPVKRSICVHRFVCCSGNCTVPVEFIEQKTVPQIRVTSSVIVMTVTRKICVHRFVCCPGNCTVPVESIVQASPLSIQYVIVVSVFVIVVKVGLFTHPVLEPVLARENRALNDDQRGGHVPQRRDNKKPKQP
jgi:hypothetical protein